MTVNGTTTTVNSTEVEIGDRIIVLNGQDAAGDSGINVYDTSTNQTGSLLWDSAGDYWKGGELGSEVKFLRQTGDSVISSSAQVDHDQTTNYSSDEHFTQANITTLGTVTVGSVTAILPSGTVSSSAQLEGTFDSRYLNTTGDSVISSSEQVNADSITNFDTNVKDKLNTDGVISSSAQLTGNFLEITGDSVVSSSIQIDHDQTTNYSADEHFTQANITTVGTVTSGDVSAILPSGTVSSSAQVNADNITNFDTNVKDKLNTEGVISSSAQLAADFLDTLGDSVVSSSAQIDHDQTTNYSSDEHFTQANITTLGTVTVGSVTAILPSGTVSSSAQVNADNITNFDTNVKDKMNTDGVISSSAQLSGNFLEITGDSVVSSSAQIDHDQTTNFSSDEHFTQANITTVGTVTAGNVTAILPAGTVSGSSQVSYTALSNIPSGIISSSAQVNADNVANFDTNVKAKLNADGVISSSAQIDHDQTTNFSSDEHFTQGDITTVGTVTSGDISAILPSGVISGSTQLSNTFLEITGDSVVSSSAQIDHDQTTNFASDEHIAHSGVDIVAGAGLTGGGTIETSRTMSVGAGDGITVNANDIQVDSTVARTNGNNTFSGDQTFSNISVTGTGSFNYIESITGSAKIIGDAYIVVNNATPAERYAGIKVFDSGSAGVTASLEFDGETNDWFYEYSDDGGTTTDHGVVIFGAEYNTKGSPTYPINNTLQKGTGTHHLADSNITDTGTLITLGSNTSITGTIVASSTTLVSSSAQISYTGLSNIPSGIISSSAQVNADNITNFDSNVKAKLNADGVISSSAQVSFSGITNKPTLVSSSAQIDHDQTTNFSAAEHFTQASITTVGTVTAGSVTAILPSGVVSSSAQLQGTFDSRYLNTTGDNVVSSSTQISHDSTTGFVSNEHIDHSTVSITAGNGLNGGGTIEATRDIYVGQGDGISVTTGQVAVDSTVVRTSGNQTIGGTKTFSGNVVVQGNTTIGNASTDTLTIVPGTITLNQGNAGAATTINNANAASNLVLTTVGGLVKVDDDFQATGEVTAYASDDRLKNRISLLENPIEKVKQLEGFTYTWNETAESIGIKNNGVKVGVSAQQVQAVLPEAVRPSPVSDEYLTVQYEKLVPLLIEGMKEQQEQIEKLRNEIEQLRNDVTR